MNEKLCVGVSGGEADPDPFIGDGPGRVVSSPLCDARLSSMAARTPRNFDSDCFGGRVGAEWRRGKGAGGEKYAWGRDGTSAHDGGPEGNMIPLSDQGGLVLEALGRPSSVSSSGGEFLDGLGAEEDAAVIIESGGKILKIWSSDCGGP